MIRYSRMILAAGIISLAACSPDVDQPQAEDGAEKIACALGEGGDFASECLVERDEVDGAIFLTVRHPDGGFRRFEQLADGRGLIEADGADQVVRTLDDQTLEIQVGPDRYRFTATVRGADAAAE